MTTETILTDLQLIEICQKYGPHEDMDLSRAIEQAVLQSPEVQAWKLDAERYRWLLEDCYRWPANGGYCNELDQSEPVALWVKRKVGYDPCAAIDAERQRRGEPVARVDSDGFIVETGLSLAPGTLLFTAPQPAEPVKVPIDDLAHEIWAAAQTSPGEGIEDAVERVAALLAQREK